MLNATLYLDNFRGFRNQFIPLKDVNFLTGENSTGKTSVLQLIYLMTQFSWWHEIDFNYGYAGLGSYSDIADNSYKDYFTIGVFRDSEPTQEESENYFYETSYKYILFSCFNYKNKIALKEVKIWGHHNNYMIHYKFKYLDSKNYYYRRYFDEGEISPPYEYFINFEFPELFEELYADSSVNLNHNHSLSELPQFGFYSILSAGQFTGMRITSNVMPLGYDTTWIAPHRAEPQKNYDKIQRGYDPKGGHVPYLLWQIFNQASENEDTIKFLNQFGKDTGLWEEVLIHDWSEQDWAAPFEVRIKLGERGLRITNVGYGISQILPILVILLNHKGMNIFALQQPEVHLHPKAQAALGTLFHATASVWDQKFLIETHSDYLITRFMIEQHKNQYPDSPITGQVLFFERNPDGTNKITPLEIGRNGFETEPPETYREFFINEQLEFLSF